MGLGLALALPTLLVNELDQAVSAVVAGCEGAKERRSAVVAGCEGAKEREGARSTSCVAASPRLFLVKRSSPRPTLQGRVSSYVLTSHHLALRHHGRPLLVNFKLLPGAEIA